MRLYQKKKHRARRAATARYKNKLKFQAENIMGYPSPVWSKGLNGWTGNKDEILYYAKVYKSKHTVRYSYYKRYSNKKVRKYDIDVRLKGGAYKKVFDYWWTVD